jgi:hypothetical protein
MSGALLDWPVNSERSLVDSLSKLNQARCDARDVLHHAKLRTLEIPLSRIGLEYAEHHTLRRRLGLLWSRHVPYVRCMLRLERVKQCAFDWRHSATQTPTRVFYGCDDDPP